MWAVRILSGPHKGRIIPITKPVSTMGRSQNADIILPDQGVSKAHARLELLGDKIIITDLNSRNGTFVNGTQVRMHNLKMGDKIVINNLVLEIIPAAAATQHSATQHSATHMTPSMGGGMTYATGQYSQPPVDFHSGPAVQQQAPTPNHPIDNFQQSANDYIENVAMPGIYKLAKVMEFKWAFGIILTVFVILVTALSAIPSMNLLKSGVEQESQHKAITIAEALAEFNREALNNGFTTGVSVDFARRKVGVKDAFIISAIDGTIIAPASKAGSSPKKYSFIQSARRTGKKAVQQLDDNTIIAMQPISTYNRQTQNYSAQYYSVVVYDMGALAVDSEQVLSLFIQILALALLLGTIVFFVLYKLVEHPINDLNQQIDLALREGRDNLYTDYNYPALSKLISNINSSLTRAHQAPDDQNIGAVEYDRSPEIANMTHLIGFPAMAVDAGNRSILSVNGAMEERLGVSTDNLLYQPVESLTDQALKLSVTDLITAADSQPDQLATHQLVFSGVEFEIACQAIFGKNSVSYFIIVLLPMEEAEAV